VVGLVFAVVVLAQKPAQKAPPKPDKPSQQKAKPAPDQTPPDDDIAGSGDTVRLSTELVNVLFTVADRNNRVVTDLNENDVTLLEDGHPQRIFTFKREATLPVSIAIVIDLSGSQEYTYPQEKMAAGEFLKAFIRPGKDSAAILTFQDDVELVQGLTSRIDTLNRAFEEIQYSRRYGPSSTRKQATALYDAVYITADEVLAHDAYRGGAADEATTRRAVILLTDGVDNASSRKLDEAIDRAWRSGVVIYSIGIGDRFRFEGVREDVLRRLSDETGGRAYFPRGPEDLLGSFKQVDSELRSQYLAAYSPTNTARDGTFRRVEVRVSGRPDLRVIHRRGYYAPADEVRK
jgi:Ca-activated chloride channel family protein